MRQSGFLAACGIYALDNNINRLKDDHFKAKEIGNVLSKLDYIKKVEPVETNIVIFELDDKFSSSIFQNKLSEKGIEIISMGDNKLRVVTHLDYNQEQHEYFLECIDKFDYNF